LRHSNSIRRIEHLWPDYVPDEVSMLADAMRQDLETATPLDPSGGNVDMAVGERLLVSEIKSHAIECLT
jgi:hypothetical protein